MFVVKKPSLAVEEVIDWLPTAVTDILSGFHWFSLSKLLMSV